MDADSGACEGLEEGATAMILNEEQMSPGSCVAFRNHCGFDVVPGMLLGLRLRRDGAVKEIVHRFSRHAMPYMHVRSTRKIKNGSVGWFDGPVPKPMPWDLPLALTSRRGEREEP